MGVAAVRSGWLRFLGTALLMAGAPPAGAERPLTLQEALLRAKPAAGLVVAEVSAEVRVNCGAGEVQSTHPVHSSTGSGWFIDPHGFVITNAHVVQPAHAPGPERIKAFTRRAVEAACVPVLLQRMGIDPARRPDAAEQIRRRVQDAIAPAAKVKLLPQVSIVLSNGARLSAEVKKYSPPVVMEPGQMAGRDLALLKVAGQDYPSLPVTHSKTVKIGDPIHILGYPGVVLSHELLNQSASVEASVTNGAVSGFKEDVANQPVIQADAPAAWGNSGGPAVNSRGEAIGVLTFVSLAPGPEGAIVQGFNFVIPSDAVVAFVRDTEVQLGPSSAFNAAWWAGLRDFFEDNFAAAERRFQEAQKLHANLPDVKRMLAEAQEKIKHPPPRPFPWAWVALGVTLTSAAGFGGLWARRWWRQRFRIGPAQVIRLMEAGQKPVFLDVRTPSDFEASPLKLPGATRLAPEAAEAERPDLALDRQQRIVAYCASPNEETSARVTRLLRRRGYRHLRILKGGLGGWTNAGLPVESKAHLPSIGVELYKSLAAGQLQARRFAAGQTIFSEGDDAKGEAFLIHSGRVEIRRRASGGDQVLRTLAEGELLGELALIREMPRSAGAVAASDVQLLVIDRQHLDWLIRNRPELTLEILRRMSGWLAEGIGSLRSPEPAAGPPPPQQ